MNIAWATLLANILVAAIAAGGINLLLIRQQRRKYDAESTDLRAGVMAKVDAQTERALDRADRCLQRLDQLEHHIDNLEVILRANGLEVPPVPTQLPWPKTRRDD